MMMTMMITIPRKARTIAKAVKMIVEIKLTTAIKMMTLRKTNKREALALALSSKHCHRCLASSRHQFTSTDDITAINDYH